MAIASDAQVQQFVNVRVRPRCEQIRALLAAMQDDKSALDDVFAALTQQNPTWTDTRTDGVPHLLTPSDVLAWNTFITNAIASFQADPQLPIVPKCCVRALLG
jgi:hypothetical protein